MGRVLSVSFLTQIPRLGAEEPGNLKLPAFKYPPRHITVKILERKKTLKETIKKVRQKKKAQQNQVVSRQRTRKETAYQDKKGLDITVL